MSIKPERVKMVSGGFSEKTTVTRDASCCANCKFFEVNPSFTWEGWCCLPSHPQKQAVDICRVCDFYEKDTP